MSASFSISTRRLIVSVGLMLLGLTDPIAGQSVTTIPSMTAPHTLLDMDAVGPTGETTVGELNLAGTQGFGTIQRLTLAPSTAMSGVYNSGTSNGRALALDPSGTGRPVLIDPPSGAFRAFDLELDLLPATEFGIAIGDWDGSVRVRFLRGGQLIDTVTTTPLRLGQGRRFFQLQPGGGVTRFDRVEIEATSSVANWVVQELWIDTSDTAGLIPYGRGCEGASGLPQLAPGVGADPALGQRFPIVIESVPNSGIPVWFLVVGRITNQTPLGQFPYDLGQIGMPGCNLYQTLDLSLRGVTMGDRAQANLQLPSNPAFSGLVLWIQGFFVDPMANRLGTVTSNAGRLEIR